MRLLDWICFFLDLRDIPESWSEEDGDHDYDYDHDNDSGSGYVVKVEPDYFLFDEETGIIHNI